MCLGFTFLPMLMEQKHMSDIEKKLTELEQTRAFISATNIVMNPKNEVLLGILHKGVQRQIPEGGDFVLIGGANGGLLPMPYDLKDLANMHLSNVGIFVSESQCSPFLPAEYDKAAVNGLLKTPFGVDSAVKRIAFDRVVQLSKDQAGNVNLKPSQHAKIAELRWVNQTDFLTIAHSKNCSFPHQVEHVLEAFALGGRLSKSIGWI